MSKEFKENEDLESFFRRQQKLIKQNEKYSRFLFAPIVVIVASLLILSYNVTAGRRIIEFDKAQEPEKIYEESLAWAKRYDKELANILEDKEYSLKVFGIEDGKNSQQRRQDKSQHCNVL